MTGNQRTDASVKVRFSNYIHIDPIRNNGLEGGAKKCQPIWDECINANRTPKENFIKLFMYFIEKYGDNSDIYVSFIKDYPQYKNQVVELDANYIDNYNQKVIETIKSKKYNINNLTDSSVKIHYTSVKTRQRSPEVAAYTRNRSEGRCDLCGNDAPFIDKNGVPFLETHHLITLSEGGPDVIFNTVALCPNCHRKMHMLDSIEDKKFLKNVIYKYLLDEKEREVLERFNKLFDEFKII